MFLRRHRREKSGEHYEYWTLVESVRTKRGPRQRIVATIGKLPGLKEEERVGWEEITRVINGKPKPAGDLFEKHKDIPEWATVDISRVGVERMRRFGDSYLGLILWKRLKLDKVFEKLQGCGREEIGWRDMFCVLALAMYKSLELWMVSKGLGNSPAKLLEEFKDIHSMDVVLPVKDGTVAKLPKNTILIKNSCSVFL